MVIEYLTSEPNNSMPLGDEAVAKTVGIPIGLYNLLNETAISMGIFYLDNNNMVRSYFVDSFIESVEKKAKSGKKGGDAKKPDLNIDTGVGNG